jgi:hypothetical protein
VLTIAVAGLLCGFAAEGAEKVTLLGMLREMKEQEQKDGVFRAKINGRGNCVR